MKEGYTEYLAVDARISELADLRIWDLDREQEVV